MPNEPRIIGFTIREREFKGDGDVQLGYFDCIVAGIELRGAMLLRTPKAGFAIRPPSIKTYGERQSVHIIDDALRHTLTELARKAYIGLGGRWGEWAPAGSDERKELDAWLSSKQ